MVRNIDRENSKFRMQPNQRRAGGVPTIKNRLFSQGKNEPGRVVSRFWQVGSHNLQINRIVKVADSEMSILPRCDDILRPSN